MENKEIARPRIVSEAERHIRQGMSKIQPRAARERVRTRELNATIRPPASVTNAVHQREKKFPAGRPAEAAAVPKVRGELEQELVNKIAWAALLISLVALVLFGVYSFRTFSPEFALQELEKKQQQLTAELNVLKLTVHAEKLKNALLTARTQLFAQHDYPAAEAQLIIAQQEITVLLGLLPVEKKDALQQAQSELERMRQDIQRGPLSFDEKLKEITSKLDQM